MAKIAIHRPHKLPHKKAREAAETIAKDLKAKFSLDYAWDGDDLSFSRPGVNGEMHVGSKELKLDVELGFLLSALKPAIEREINSQLDLVLGKHPAGGARSTKA